MFYKEITFIVLIEAASHTVFHQSQLLLTAGIHEASLLIFYHLPQLENGS
jgi:hypothetical protein